VYAIKTAGLTICVVYIESATKAKLQRENSFQQLALNIYCRPTRFGRYESGF